MRPKTKEIQEAQRRSGSRGSLNLNFDILADEERAERRAAAIAKAREVERRNENILCAVGAVATIGAVYAAMYSALPIAALLGVI